MINSVPRHPSYLNEFELFNSLNFLSPSCGGTDIIWPPLKLPSLLIGAIYLPSSSSSSPLPPTLQEVSWTTCCLSVHSLGLQYEPRRTADQTSGAQSGLYSLHYS